MNQEIPYEQPRLPDFISFTFFFFLRGYLSPCKLRETKKKRKEEIQTGYGGVPVTAVGLVPRVKKSLRPIGERPDSNRAATRTITAPLTESVFLVFRAGSGGPADRLPRLRRRHRDRPPKGDPPPSYIYIYTRLAEFKGGPSLYSFGPSAGRNGDSEHPTEQEEVVASGSPGRLTRRPR